MTRRLSYFFVFCIFLGSFLLGYYAKDTDFFGNKNLFFLTTENSGASIDSGSISETKDFTFPKLVDTRIDEAYDIIEKNYYHFSEKQVSDIQDGVIRGVVTALDDKHSEFFTAEEAKDFNAQLSGDLEGIGAVIDSYDKGVIIEQILDDSPAKEAGLVPGDVILSANGTSLRDMLPSEAVKYIKGPANTKVDLMIQKGGIGEEELVTIIRRKIIIPSVRAEILTGVTATGNIGYIDLSIFGENSPEEFNTKLGEILDANPKGLIIDLRQNGGGFLDVAVDILSHFFPRDTVLVMTRENDPKNDSTLFSHGSDRMVDSTLPIVILVDGYSASASEIVSGAFQDYKRAILVGETTYGKGSVQQPFMLSDGSELKITVARWFTPLDRGIDLIGVTPDILSQLTLSDYENAHDRQLETAKDVISTWFLNESRDETIATFTSSGKTMNLSGTLDSGVSDK